MDPSPATACYSRLLTARPIRKMEKTTHPPIHPGLWRGEMSYKKETWANPLTAHTIGKAPI
jgi:hypothetical protein